MRANPIDICPLGPHLQHYWDRLSYREKKMEFDEEALFSLALESVALNIAEKTPYYSNLINLLFSLQDRNTK